MKEGFLTKEEAKFFGKLLANELPIGGMWQSVSGWFLPTLVDTIDNKFADRVPEPWQTHIEKLVTLTYEAMQDKVLTPEEAEEISLYCATVMNTEVDIPWFSEDDEALIFIQLWKLVASMLLKVMNNVKKENQ